MFGLVKGVLVSGYEKALVVRAAVAKHNLRRVLIGHDDRRSGQTAAVGKRVIHFERFLHHASVQVGSHLENLANRLHITYWQTETVSDDFKAPRSMGLLLGL